MIKRILTLCALVAFSSAFTKKEAMQYLFDFEHITALEDDQFGSGLRKFQKFAAIPITAKESWYKNMSRWDNFFNIYINTGLDNFYTIYKVCAIYGFKDYRGIIYGDIGILDRETKRMMQVPRCFNPNPDRNGPVNRYRRKRYVAHHTKWSQRALNYHMNYPKNVDRGLIERGLRRSFDMWASQTGLAFKPSSKLTAHLDMRFDGTKLRILGYAYYPGYGGGRIVFSTGERWTENTRQHTNFYQVAIHEIGHALGLQHSNIRESVMFPFYGGYDPDYKLHHDDIAGIKSLYNY